MFYKKRCKNNIHIKEKDLNQIIKNEVIKKLSLSEIFANIDELTYYCMKSDEDIQKIKEYKKEIAKWERKKNILYKNKCEQYITVEQFKTEYENAKEEIKRIESLIEELKNNILSEQKGKRIKEIIGKIQEGSFINNTFLKKIINKIEVDSKNKIEITFNI